MGAKWSTRFAHDDWTIESSAQARWLHAFGDLYGELDVAFAGAPESSFRVRGATLPRDRGAVGLGITADKGGLQLFADYNYQSGDGYEAHHLGAGVRWRW